MGSWGPCFRDTLSVEALSQVHWEDGRQALCMEPDAWKPLDTVHCPHCRSGWNICFNPGAVQLHCKQPDAKWHSHTLPGPPATGHTKPHSWDAPKIKVLPTGTTSCPLYFSWARVFLPGYPEFWSQLALCSCGCPVHCRVLSRIPGLFSLGAGSSPFIAITKNVSRHCQIISGGTTAP